MADYEAYGPWVGGDDWRAWVGVYVTTNNATTLAGRVESWVWSEYGTTSGNANIQGAAAWDQGDWQNGSATSISTNSWKKLKVVTFSVAKGHSATSKTAWAKAEGISGIYSGRSSQATVSVPVGAKPSYAVSYNANGGSGAPSGQKKWYGESLTLSTTRPTRTNYTFKGWATSSGGGVAYAPGANYTANAAVTLYAVWQRSYTVPNAVTNLALARSSDTQLKATWTNNSAVPREYTKLQVNAQTDDGSWVELSSSLGASTVNYVWNGAQANHKYRLAVRPYNPAGWGSWAYSGYVYTTPAAPSSVVATVPSAGSVAVEVTAGAPWAESHVVEVTADGGETWTQVGTVAGAGGTYTDTTPPAGTCQYRARAVIGELVSAYTTSTEIVTLCPPLAPTITQRPAAAIATDTTVTLAWAPNHPDGTAQTKAEVEVTAGGSTTTIAITGATTTVDLSSYAQTAQSVSVRVRTYGLYAAWGAWSDVVAFTAYVPPSATITAPSTDGAVERQLPVTIAWSAVDATGISSQVLRLFDGDGRQLRSWQLDGSARSFDLDRTSYFLTNGQSYSVTLVVSAGSTLQATATRAFSIDYLGPAEPTADLVWDEDALSCAVTVGEGEDGTGTLPVPDSFYVVRVMPDGSEWLVAEGLSSSQQAIDPLPPLGVEFAYRVVAVAESGVETAAEFAATYDTNAWAFGFGQGVAETVLLLADPSASESWEHGGESYHFADGSGDGLPLWYGTDVLEVSHSWSFAIPTKWADVAEHAASLFRRFSTCWVRNPFGNRWHVFAKASMTVKPGPRWSVSVNADELRWTEAS